ncbi:MAG TPA: hypothetical protein VMB71_05700 [Acetobacteraceae bacterium]|nr:hypothetical protein [Acetobacteraceae bacterium]
MSTLADRRSIKPATGFFPGAENISPLVLADRLLTLAQDADRAGFSRPAERLLRLAYAMCNERPH